MRRFKNIVFTLSGLALYCYAPSALGQDFDIDEQEIQALGVLHMCETLAVDAGLISEAEVWKAYRENNENSLMYQLGREAAEDFSDQWRGKNDPKLSQQCDESLEYVKNLDTAVDAERSSGEIEWVSVESIATTDRLRGLVEGLDGELVLSGYAHEDNQILLRHAKELKEFYGSNNAKKSDEALEGLYVLAIEALKSQRAGFKNADASSKVGENLLKLSNFCLDVANYTLFEKPGISDAEAPAHAVRSLLYKGMKNHRTAIGGENTRDKDWEARFAALDSADDLEKATILLYGTQLCLRSNVDAMANVFTVLIEQPISNAEKIIAKGG